MRSAVGLQSRRAEQKNEVLSWGVRHFGVREESEKVLGQSDAHICTAKMGQYMGSEEGLTSCCEILTSL